MLYSVTKDREMTLTITDQTTIDRINKLASERHLSPEQVVREAVAKAEQPTRANLTPEQQALMERLGEIANRCAARPTIDNRSAEEILGYDANGLPS
jgi:antitoxin VapB